MRVYLGLGSNLGDRQKHIEDAIYLLAAAPGFHLVRCAGLYESAPVGPSQPRFLNTALSADTDLDFPGLLSLCKETEKKVGRVPSFHWGPRAIDVDILAAEGGVHLSPTLCVPHRELPNRRFALEPLCELCPELIPDHAPGGQSVRKLLSGVMDQDVRRIC